MVKDNKTKMSMAKVVPNKGVREYSVEVVRRFVEQLGYKALILKSASEAPMSAWKEAVGRGKRGDCDGGVTCRRSSGERCCGERCEKGTGPVPGVEECVGV